MTIARRIDVGVVRAAPACSRFVVIGPYARRPFTAFPGHHAHHRIFLFHADGADRLYLSSADWMERNFFRRIEVAFPILEPRLKRRVIKEGLRAYLLDNCQAWEMGSDGQYRRIALGRRQRRAAQELLLMSLAAD